MQLVQQKQRKNRERRNNKCLVVHHSLLSRFIFDLFYDHFTVYALWIRHLSHVFSNPVCTQYANATTKLWNSHKNLKIMKCEFNANPFLTHTNIDTNIYSHVILMTKSSLWMNRHNTVFAVFFKIITFTLIQYHLVTQNTYYTYLFRTEIQLIDTLRRFREEWCHQIHMRLRSSYTYTWNI